MASVQAKITGIDDINLMLDKLEVNPDVAKRALMAGAEVLLPKLAAAAPVRTGTLKRSMKIGKFSVKGSGAVSLTVGSDHKVAPHAHFVESGHGGPKPASAHPFLAPTYDANAEAVTAVIMDIVSKELI